jgi:predicted transcriptional regulator
MMPRVTLPIANKMIALWETGSTISEIADITGYSSPTVATHTAGVAPGVIFGKTYPTRKRAKVRLNFTARELEIADKAWEVQKALPKHRVPGLCPTCGSVASRCLTAKGTIASKWHDNRPFVDPRE